MDRLRIEQNISEEALTKQYIEFSHRYTGFEIIKASSEIFQRAKEAFPVAVRTLDAIHLSSLLFVRDYLFTNANWTFISHDKRQLNAAQTLGFVVDG